MGRHPCPSETETPRAFGIAGNNFSLCPSGLLQGIGLDHLPAGSQVELAQLAQHPPHQLVLCPFRGLRSPATQCPWHPCTILIAQQRKVPIMAGATKEAVIEDADEAALRRFEEGLARSIKQYKAGEVEAFDDKEEFIRTLIE